MKSIIFAGQGAQKAGMGKELAGSSEAAKRIFQIADEYSSGRISKLCFEGPQNELDLTINTQPCVFTVEAAYLAAMQEKGTEAGATAGFSLGEYGALVCSGVLKFEDALDIVSKRGELMNAAAEANEGSMAAILGVGAETLLKLCSETEGYLEPVNYNCPGQTVVAGDKNSITQLIAKVKEMNIGKAIPLAVSGAFHSKHMKEASVEFEKYLGKFVFNNPIIPFVSNVTGDFVKSGEELRGLAVRQMRSPVLWEKSVRTLINSGSDIFIEAGPGKTLTGFMKKIDAGVEAVHADSVIIF